METRVSLKCFVNGCRTGWNVPETTLNNWNKEKYPCTWATYDIDSHSVVLDSVNSHLK